MVLVQDRWIVLPSTMEMMTMQKWFWGVRVHKTALWALGTTTKQAGMRTPVLPASQCQSSSTR
jgi:hypothetical protein